MHAAFCSIFHSSDIFWPVWCLIHLGSFGIIWERSIEKCQWLEDGWSMLKQFIAALKQNRWGLHGLDYLQLGQNCWFGFLSYRVLSLIYALCVTIWQQLHLICVTFVLQYCLSVYVRLVFFESLWNDVCPGMSGVLKACPKARDILKRSKPNCIVQL